VKETVQQRFDRLLEQVLAELPENLTRLLDEVPIVVDERPGADVLRHLGVADSQVLCGLYTGIPLTRRSVLHSAVMPDKVQIFREGIVAAASSANGIATDDSLKRQIRITVLHEMGHHFGLDEKDLRRLGYS